MSWIPIPFAGHSCEFSPFHGNLLAIGTAQYYGLVGNGRLHVYDLSSGHALPVAEWLTNAGCYDTSWSEANEHVLVTAQADGKLMFFDWTQSAGPIMTIDAHSAEAVGVDWSAIDRNLVVSASWDNTTKVHDAMQGVTVRTYNAHTEIAYAAIWSPHRPGVFASVSGDPALHICDINSPGSAPVSMCQAHQHEILTVDWHKYNECQVITGSVDRTCRVFDVRSLQAPLMELHGHQLAVRRLKTHPHNPDQVVSASYDMGVILWSLAEARPVRRFDHHTEFVVGIDLSLFEENVICSTAWDRAACLWNLVTDTPLNQPPHP